VAKGQNAKQDGIQSKGASSNSKPHTQKKKKQKKQKKTWAVLKDTQDGPPFQLRRMPLSSSWVSGLPCEVLRHSGSR